MYPEVRAAVAADTGPDFRAPGFDLAAHREEVRLASLELPREEVGAVEDVDADGVPCRLFTPEDPLHGLVVHAHGGGFVLNDVDVHEGICRRMANRGRRAVLSVEYRRPPEDPFPAAPDDLDTVVRWLRDGHGPQGPYAAHGDSAGGTLALWAAARHRLPAGAPGAAPQLRPVAAVSQAGINDLVAGAEEGLGDDAVVALVGARPGDDPEGVYAVTSPQALLPLGVPTLVVTGEADAGLVYATDAVAAADDVDAVEIAGAEEALTSYLATTLQQTEHADLAADWVAWVTSPEGRAILADAGFGSP